MRKRRSQYYKKQKSHIFSKTNRASGLLISSIIISMPSYSTAGETVTFPGNGTLATVNSIENSLAPSGSDTGKSNTLSGNHVSVNNASAVNGDVYGAINLNDAETVTNNHVVISSGGLIGRYVYGGYSREGSVTGNTVTIENGSTVNYYVDGGYGKHDATGNTVDINGGTVHSVVSGGSSDGNTANNTVTVRNGSSVSGNIYGGYSNSDSNGDVTGNTVTIDSSSSGEWNVYGGHGLSMQGGVTGNTVNINGGTVHQSVYGGANSGNATNNTVTVSHGSSIGADLYGGYSYLDRDAFTGNTLNIKAADLSIGGDLKNFEHLNFYLPSTMTANTPVLTVGGEADLTGGTGSSSTVNVSIAGGASPLTAGDSIRLIHATTLTTNSDLNTTANRRGSQGISLRYDFDLLTDTANNELLAVVKPGGVMINPQSKALSEARLAGTSFVTQGADLLTGIGMQNMVLQTGEIGTFGVIQGSSIRHKTGSHVDVDGTTLLLGAATRNAFNLDNLTAGVFIEAGWGNYDSYNSSGNAASVHGDGDTNYYGAGLMGRLDLSNGLYADSTLRIGRVETDFKSRDLVDMFAQRASYESKSTYSGISLGLGKIINLDEQKSIDFYGRYLWTHISSDNVTVLGDTFNFDSVNSHRLRAGLRYTQQYTTSSSFYAGAAYDYEFDGDAKGSVYGYRMDTPSLEGGSGIFDVGLTLRPQNNARLSVDTGLQGYAGQREGVSGSVKMNYAF